MDEKIYKIILADGTMIENLRLNGNNFISGERIDPAVFDGNCSPIVIVGGDATEEIHEAMEFVQATEYGGEWWFVLRDLSAEELTRIKMQSDIEYVAMMAGVEL